MAEEVFSNEIEKHCIHGQDSPCSCACPFPLNVREFLAKIKKGSFHAAFNMYREAVSFPELVWRICPAPCGRACQKALEQPVNMPMLEQAAVAYARSTDPINYNLPEKPEKIAVVGSGLSGLSCARRLAVMNYKVTVFEQKEEICTSLEKLLPRNIFEPAIQKQFQFTSCQFKTGEAVSDTSELEFDAVYFSSGVDLKEDSLRAFSSPADLSPVEELVEGVRVADSIEWFLKQETTNLFRKRLLTGNGWRRLRRYLTARSRKDMRKEKPDRRQNAVPFVIVRHVCRNVCLCVIMVRHRRIWKEMRGLPLMYFRNSRQEPV